MTFIITLVSIIQSFSISLGVGSSTLAILNFFNAIADGTIEPTERRMMGVVYIVLRIAMILILLTTLSLVAQIYLATGEFSTYSMAQMTALAILFLNAILMTVHKMPSTFGPAIQAGSWYTLGTLAALLPLGYVHFEYWHFILGYITWVVLAIGIVNGTMSILKSRLDEMKKKNPA